MGFFRPGNTNPNSERSYRMLRTPGNLSAAVFAAILAPFALASQTHVVTPSTWTLNLQQSDFGGGPAMKSDVITVQTDTDKWLKFTDVTVDGDGKTWNTAWSGPADGTSHPLKGMPGATFSQNAATDVDVMTLPDGTEITCSYSLSPDKKKMTNKCAAKSKDGKVVNQTTVYERTK